MAQVLLTAEAEESRIELWLRVAQDSNQIIHCCRECRDTLS